MTVKYKKTNLWRLERCLLCKSQDLLKSKPDVVDNVVFPGNSIQSDGVNVLILMVSRALDQDLQRRARQRRNTAAP